MIIKSINNVLKNFKKELTKKLIKKALDRHDIILSKRQNKALKKLLEKDKNFLTIDEYKKKFKIAYETARTDLNQLVDIRLLQKVKIGKKFIYKLNKVENIISNTKSEKMD